MIEVTFEGKDERNCNTLHVSALFMSYNKHLYRNFCTEQLENKW